MGSTPQIDLLLFYDCYYWKSHKSKNEGEFKYRRCREIKNLAMNGHLAIWTAWQAHHKKPGKADETQRSAPSHFPSHLL